MAGAADRFVEAASRAGLTVQVRRFAEETRTAPDAARSIGCDVAQIVKSLVLVADGEPFVALTSGANRAGSDRLARLLGAKEVRRATPEEARDATGFAIGGTPPLGYVRPVRVLMDRDLLDHDVVWAAAGAPDTVFPVAPAALRAAAGAEVADLKEPG